MDLSKIHSSADHIVLHLLDELGRYRALRDDESMALEKIIRRQGPKRCDKPWTREHDDIVRAIMPEVEANAAGPRFRPNSTINDAAQRLGRTPEAVRRRLWLLRNGAKSYEDREAERMRVDQAAFTFAEAAE